MKHPFVLSISGHDPTGGAGIQADIESIIACGGRPVTALTCTTVQDTAKVYRLIGSDPAVMREQAERLFDDLPIAAVKIGLIGSARMAAEIASLLLDHRRIPVVLDPVLASGAGADLTDSRLIPTLREQLLPLTLLLTPNSLEARRIGHSDDLPECVERLFGYGCGSVLITGTHEAHDQVVNSLYRRDGQTGSSRWPRLPASYHGSGCTLAAAAATCLARGLELEDAVTEALDYTWNALNRGDRPGRGQWLPARLPRQWSASSDGERGR
ncbi:MAG: hydroxymethylpyrimidine/phosphomethylpyrimidine kinase [Gammaproteobacteria bacterium]|nr:hydroxymethylpyrimidine/phosphomethylpyrimidine kinase [Gammaproteobacteria bacterium]